MNRTRLIVALTIALFSTLGLSSTAALADKPEWAGKGKNKEREGRQDEGRRDEGRNDGGKHDRDRRSEMRFDSHDRDLVRGYFGEQERAGRCPPGLAKKHNGCMPPGQAKKWAVGQPLPRDVVVYEVPRPLVVQLGTPPAGYKYVRAASDILLIAVGTSMVVDAIQDLGRL